MKRRFTVGIGPNENGHRFWMNVVVYDTKEDMHQATLRHRPKSDAESVAESGGCFQAANSAHPSYLGIMRLTQEFLVPAAVVHESVHAALVYVQKVKDVARLHLDAWSDGERIIDNEESLAYSVHGIASALLAELALVTPQGET